MMNEPERVLRYIRREYKWFSDIEELADKMRGEAVQALAEGMPIPVMWHRVKRRAIDYVRQYGPHSRAGYAQMQPLDHHKLFIGRGGERHLTDEDKMDYLANRQGSCDDGKTMMNFAIVKKLWPCLSPMQAIILQRHYYLDQSQADIAEDLGISENSVSFHCFRGVRRLRMNIDLYNKNVPRELQITR